MIGWAVKEDALFDQVADLIPFRTARGMLTLPEYLALTGNVIYYSTAIVAGLQQLLIHQGDEHLAIDASNFVEPGFLVKYARRHPEIQLIRLDDQNELLSDERNVEKFASVMTFYEQIGVEARMTRFQPVEIPAVMTFPSVTAGSCRYRASPR